MPTNVANIFPSDRLRGYHPAKTLGIKPGDQVSFLKGSRLFSMHPKRQGWYAAIRKQIVEVDHLLSGCTWTLGSKYTLDGHSTDLYPQVRHKDVAEFARSLGFEGAWQDIKGTFDFLLRFCVAEPDRGHTVYKLPVANPSVRWAGQGGYWVECDINDVCGIL